MSANTEYYYTFTQLAMELEIHPVRLEGYIQWGYVKPTYINDLSRFLLTDRDIKLLKAFVINETMQWRLKKLIRKMGKDSVVHLSP